MATEYYKAKGKEKEKSNEFHSCFLERLSEYPIVDYGYKSASEYYCNLKKSNRLLRFGLEQFVEGSVGGYWAIPFKNTTWRLFGFIGRPLLSRLDSFACYELDRFEDSDLIELPFTLFDRSLDIAEGTMDYFLEPSKSTLEIEHQNEEKLDNENFELLDLEGKYMDAALSRLRYLECRLVGIGTSLQLRTRDTLSRHPIWVQLADFVGARLLTILQAVQDLLRTPGELLSLMNKLRNSVMGYVEDVTKQTVVLIYVTVEPIIRLAQNAFAVSRKRLDQLVFNIEQNVDWVTGYFLPDRLCAAVRRLFLLFRTFITTGRLNLTKVEATLKEAGPSEAKHKHKKGAGLEFIQPAESTMQQTGKEEGYQTAGAPAEEEAVRTTEGEMQQQPGAIIGEGEGRGSQRSAQQQQHDDRLKSIKSGAERKGPTEETSTTEGLLTEEPRHTEKPAKRSQAEVPSKKETAADVSHPPKSVATSSEQKPEQALTPGEEAELPKAHPQMLQRDMPQWEDKPAPTEPRVGVGMMKPKTYAEALHTKATSNESPEAFPKAQPEILQHDMPKNQSEIPASEPRVGAWLPFHHQQAEGGMKLQPAQQQQEEGKPVKSEEQAEKPLADREGDMKQQPAQQPQESGKKKQEIGVKQQVAERSKQDDELARGSRAAGSQRLGTGAYLEGTVARHVTHFEEMSKEDRPAVVGK